MRTFFNGKAPLIAAIVLLAACGKKPNPAPGTPPVPSASEAQIRETFGFAGRAPADAEAYLGAYQLTALWHDLKTSKPVASLMATSVMQQWLGNGSEMNGKWKSFSAKPETVAWRAIASDAFAKEAFVILDAGSAEKIRLWQRLGNEVRIQQLKTGLARPKTPPDPLAQWVPVLIENERALEVPPMVYGFKFSKQKEAFAAELAKLEKNLPPGVDASTFTPPGAGTPFKSLVFDASKLITPLQQASIRNGIEAKTHDAATADSALRVLMSRRMEIDYGWLDDYFVVAVGTDHAHLHFAADYKDSVLALPEMKICSQFADKHPVCLSWSGLPMVALSIPQVALSPWYEKIKPDVAGMLQPAQAAKLEADLVRIDQKGAKVFPQAADPMVAFTVRNHGLTSETFGGPKLSGTLAVKPLRFAAVPADSTFLWVAQHCDPATGAALCDWLEDIASSADDLAQDVAPQLPGQAGSTFGVFQNVAAPKIAALYHITRDEFARGLGQESAFGMDFSGAVPALPMIPEAIQHDGALPRIGYVSDVTDGALLAKSWQDYFKLAKEIALLVPHTPKMPAGVTVPEPSSRVENGITLSYYPLPMPTGDLVPVLATTNETFVASTSMAYAIELTNAAHKPAPADAKPAAVEFHVKLKALYDYAGKWCALAGAHPDVMFGKDAAKAAKFAQAQPDIQRIIDALRAFEGMDLRVYEENGLRRTSASIGFKP